MPFVVLLLIVTVSYVVSLSNKTKLRHLVSSSKSVSKLAKLSGLSKVDEVAETNVVATLADRANLPIALYASNSAKSAEIQAKMTQKSDSLIDKPLIVSLGDAAQSVKTHVVKPGETLDSIASSYSVSVQTIKWANNLTTNTVASGKTLKILPVDGVYYKVKAGDSFDKIVKRYGSNQGHIVAINNLELSGLKPGAMIVIPGGNLPENERPGYVAPRPSVHTGSVALIYRPANGAGVKYYPWGWCTWYAAYRFPQLNGGKQIGNWGNASTWDNAAAGTAGYTVTRRPVPGAIFQADGPPQSWDWRGHVGIVEAVEYRPDGSIASVKVSDMNGSAGWGRVGYATWTAAKAAGYKYIK